MAIGIFGGRFDPPHVGHVALARAAVSHYELDELRVAVVVDAAHKRAEAPAEHRLAMAERAFADPDLRATVELEEHRFTVDALEAGRHVDPIFLVGADQLVDFPTWKEPARVLELARLGVAARTGFRLEHDSERIGTFELEAYDVSSTEIRARVCAGEPIAGLVPPEVALYIEEYGLYREGSISA